MKGFVLGTRHFLPSPYLSPAFAGSRDAHRRIHDASEKLAGPGPGKCLSPPPYVSITGIVVRGGPAHRAGMQPGDVIVAIDGKKIAEARQALLAISSRKPGSRVKLEVLRNGKSLTLEATAIERPARAALTE